MSVTAVLINLLALAFLAAAFARDRARAIQALRVAVKSLFGILPAVLAIIVVIGLLLAFATPGQISRFVGEQAGLAGIVVIAALGAVLYIPAIVAWSPFVPRGMDSQQTERSFCKVRPARFDVKAIRSRELQGHGEELRGGRGTRLTGRAGVNIQRSTF